MPLKPLKVALLAEGVDRNIPILSASSACVVALLAEGVDRNIQNLGNTLKNGLSPSSRRAWIEISV